MAGYDERCALLDFLELSYKGGVAYKFGLDPKGQPVLIEHENERGGMLAAVANRTGAAGGQLDAALAEKLPALNPHRDPVGHRFGPLHLGLELVARHLDVAHPAHIGLRAIEGAGGKQLAQKGVVELGK